MGYVVEFCGLPTAGKSTLARAVVAQLRLRGVPTTEVMATLGPDAGRSARLTRKIASIGLAAVEPGSVAVVTGVGLRSGQRDIRDRVARPANLLVVRHAVRRARRRPGVHILDQGPLQEWWSAALRADDRRVLRQSGADPAEHSDLMVRVETPIPVLLARLAARGPRQSRLEAVGPEEQRRELERGELLLDSLSDQLVHSSGLDGPGILRVDGQDPATAEAIAEVVVANA
ncbi:MAG: AAA family ATPase [Acidimicrobiia bacterium]